ncbi:hypothetical protein EI77_03988 [Prosthecobacter fusiformis]|uniref:Uncharacterized protein n=1 Tax=Prosthecobacter fusiformis TaxID=48464 RepID=A0A4R7RK62_9BACT|nr:hypothetical protein [Prosthecobacter fusiformis]TDU64538.1 hypothetical protein EI77_03988 [Prosthecobacter fusiformis]
MNRRHFLTAAATVPLSTWALPFDPEVISRLSLDGKPRSLSVRQGADVWLGYDLERATVFKAWQAPKAKTGLIKNGFMTRSAGTVWFEDTTNDQWTLQRGEKHLPLIIRYLGCTHVQDHIDLRWDLGHDGGVLKLYERIPLGAAPASDRVVRELRVESLDAGDAVVLPASIQKAWKLQTNQGDAKPALTSTALYRLTLP